MSHALEATHSARVWNFPAAISGPRIGMSSSAASHRYELIDDSSIGSSSQEKFSSSSARPSRSASMRLYE